MSDRFDRAWRSLFAAWGACLFNWTVIGAHQIVPIVSDPYYSAVLFLGLAVMLVFTARGLWLGLRA